MQIEKLKEKCDELTKQLEDLQTEHNKVKEVSLEMKQTKVYLLFKRATSYKHIVVLVKIVFGSSKLNVFIHSFFRHFGQFNEMGVSKPELFVYLFISILQSPGSVFYLDSSAGLVIQVNKLNSFRVKQVDLRLTNFVSSTLLTTTRNLVNNSKD